MCMKVNVTNVHNQNICKISTTLTPDPEVKGERESNKSIKIFLTFP